MRPELNNLKECIKECITAHIDNQQKLISSIDRVQQPLDMIVSEIEDPTHQATISYAVGQTRKSTKKILEDLEDLGLKIDHFTHNNS